MDKQFPIFLLQVIFSDEASIEVQMAQPRRIRKRPEPYSSRHMAMRVKKPQKVMIWACMSSQGMGRIHVVDGSMNANQYLCVLRTRLVPQASDWFGDDFIYQHDEAPCHTAKVIKKYFEENQIRVLPWPSNSPDMSPIETIWAIIKRQLERHTLTSRSDLINRLLDVTQRDTEVKQKLDESCRKLMLSMPERVSALLQAKGGHTKF